MPDPTPDLTATLERVNELAEWMDDGDETFILRMSERMRAAADLRALCAAVETLTAERDAANAAHDRVAKSLGVTAEGAVEIAEENVRLRAEHARLRADLAAKVEGLKRLAHAGSDLNEEDCVHCAHNAAIDAVQAILQEDA